MTWREAFLRQAESDYAVFLEFNRAGKPPAQQLHYLQMATEKLAKAFCCGPANDPPKTTHAALGRFLRISKGQPKIRGGLGYGGDYAAFSGYVDSLLPFAEKIERLAPEGGRLNTPNPEYPWQDSLGEVVAPVDHPFEELMSDAPNMNKLKRLVPNLIRIASRA